MTRSDRIDAGWLALVLALFGFIVAPLLHGVGHEHGHHHEGDVPSGQHGQRSLEHQSLGFVAPAATVEPVRFAVAISSPSAATARVVHMLRPRSPEQPQGP